MNNPLSPPLTKGGLRGLFVLNLYCSKFIVLFRGIHYINQKKVRSHGNLAAAKMLKFFREGEFHVYILGTPAEQVETMKDYLMNLWD